MCAHIYECGVGCYDALCCGMNLYESTKRYCEVGQQYTVNNLAGWLSDWPAE